MSEGASHLRTMLQTLLCAVHEHFCVEIDTLGRRDLVARHTERVCCFLRTSFLIFTCPADRVVVAAFFKTLVAVTFILSR